MGLADLPRRHAPGVGKTFAMLGEGWRRRERGADVVIGLVETHGGAVVARQVCDLESVPRQRITRGATFEEEMDVDAIIARRPQVALVDELAHTNVPGSRNAKRWQDVEELLETGVTVISTLNIQHMESLKDVIERITGVKEPETIPDAVVRAADQVELIDMSPEAIRRRMAHGNIYAPEANRARAEAAALARLAGSLLDSDDPLPHLVNDLRATFQLDSVAVLRRYGSGWTVEASAGQPMPASPEDGTDALMLSGDATLVLAGPRTPADDRRLLASFAAQLAVAVATRQLRARAEDASVQARAHELRSALLAAVSHDLRTPLASIKASATSLLQADVSWQPEATEEFLRAIVAEADRLNALVGNLLDMSRLQSGVLQVHNQPVGLDEVVPAALLGLPKDGARIEVDVSETLPLVDADPALLERVVANLVSNALQWSPPGEPVRIRAGAVAGHIHLGVADRGPGIPPADRDKVFQPFQRLGDRAPGSVGLGLAVARGFVEAVGGQLVVDDTPGGGTTMTVTLKAVTEPHGGGR